MYFPARPVDDRSEGQCSLRRADERARGRLIAFTNDQSRLSYYAPIFSSIVSRFVKRAIPCAIRSSPDLINTRYSKLILLWLEIDKLGLSTRDSFRSSFVEVGGMSDDGPDFTRLSRKSHSRFVRGFFNVLGNRVTDRHRGDDGRR